MDRFSWFNGKPNDFEWEVFKQAGIRIYDGDSKTNFDDGCSVLTSHRIYWTDSKNSKIIISLSLDLIVNSSRQAGGFTRSPKIILKLQAAPSSGHQGPVARSRYDFIKLSFKEGGDENFFKHLQDNLQNRTWAGGYPKSSSTSSMSTSAMSAGSAKPRASGIVGIERKLEEKQRKTDATISVAFQDLTKLMDKAKEMVAVSSSIATKIKDKKGDITDDETVKFKSYLLSLGIANPVTKEEYGSGTHYHMQLAHEIASLLEEPVTQNGGNMLLADAFCRINRARGMELLSPEDILNACKMLAKLKLSIKLRSFDSGVLVLQTMSYNDDDIIKETTTLVQESTSLSAQELANLLSISILLAKERLLLAEKEATLCRDDSDEGLRFYPNLFAGMV